MTRARAIPTSFTPAGGWTEMPPPVLGGCSDPLADDAPDLRGTWKVVDLRDDAGIPDADHPVWGHVERIEQADRRVVITAGGVVHDLWADGTDEHGVHDVMAADFTTPIVVAGSFEQGVLVLRPRGLPGVEVRRWREGPHLVWRYHSAFTARLERVDP